MPPLPLPLPLLLHAAAGAAASDHPFFRPSPAAPQDFLINVLLTLLGFIPGVIHAIYIIAKY
jgi:hypothetical protein